MVSDPSLAHGLRCSRAEAPAGQSRLVLQGALDRRGVSSLLDAVEAAWPKPPHTLSLDLSAVDAIDGSGAAALLHLWRVAERRGVPLHIEHVPEPVRAKLALFRVEEHPPRPPTQPPGLIEGAGEAGIKLGQGALALLVLASDTTAELLHDTIAPRRVRWAELFHQLSLIGSQGLGTIGLITFLVGLTMAFQSAHQLRQFGADIYVADLTAVAMMREMGPLMTAILLAGRSGSAIAAEIATMKVSEELDALEVMGIPFVQFLAMPRLLATLIAMPLLVILADLIGIAGGMLVGVSYLDISPGPYLAETISALGPKDLIMSLSKAVVFGWGVALIALFNGLQVRGGAQEVGRAATSSVVQALFFIILSDAAFSILFYVVL